MRKQIIAGNWKMYKTVEEAQQFMKEVVKALSPSSSIETVICAPALYLAQLVELAKDSAIGIGAQTMHSVEEGAFTGEISPTMLTSVGVTYVILGHSERRAYYNETDEAVNEKVQAAIASHLTPLICVGESLEEREAGTTVNKVARQVRAALKEVAAEDAKRVVIAYEPIWAIGTGKTATAEDANDVCRAIREEVQSLYDEEVAQAVRIQYGGSVNPSNIQELLSKSDIDGALVGGASLQPASFLQLIEVGNQ